MRHPQGLLLVTIVPSTSLCVHSLDHMQQGKRHRQSGAVAAAPMCLHVASCSVLLLFQEPAKVPEGVSISSDGDVLTKDGVEYRIGDHVYVHPDTFDQLEQAATAEVPDYAAKGRFHKVASLQMYAPYPSPPY